MNDPVENITVKPLESNLLLWYFVIDGPVNTPYENGKYFGVIQFAPNYPFAPPDFIMYTPNGRFKPDTKICLSFSAFHKETWNPLWTVSSMLVGLVSFMTSNEASTGCVQTDDSYKKVMANDSLRFNQMNQIYKDLFGK